MRRVCLIGDSHIAALKTAWDEIRGELDHEATFFAARGGKFEVVVENGALLAANEITRQNFEMTSGGRSRIDPADYDAILVVGGRFSLNKIINLHGGFRAESHTPHPARRSVSDDCFFDASVGALRQSEALKVREALRGLTDMPVVIVQQPMHSESYLKDPDAKSLREIVNHGDDAALAQTFEQAKQALRSSDTIIFDQPAETLSRRIFSKDAFANTPSLLRNWEDFAAPADETAPKAKSKAPQARAGAKNASPPRPDYVHMNTAYGVVVLRKLLAQGLL